MTFRQTDVVVHLAEVPDGRARARLEAALGAQPGVRRVRSDARHLLVVDFDRQAISALGVLRCVQAQGHRARLIGM
jgi:hypothetical protein